MKTALEQAIEACKECGETSHYARLCIDIMKEYLPTEKQQIVDAYEKGFEVGFDPKGTLSGKAYFTQTFKND